VVRVENAELVAHVGTLRFDVFVKAKSSRVYAAQERRALRANGLAAAGSGNRITPLVAAMTLTGTRSRWFLVTSVITLRD
jgi:hypothetical protein